MNYNTMLMLSVGLLSAFTNIHAAEESGKCRPLDDSAAIVASITNWVERYRISPEFRVERDGTNTYIRGTVGRFPSLFSKYDIVVDLDSESQEAYCYGYLPTCVPDERRAEMVEFVFRAECSYGISPAALVLEDDGSVRCQSWLPFMTLKESPDRAIPRLVGSVMEKLYVCSQAVGPVLVGSEKPSCASRVEPVGLFGKEYESPQSSNAADTDMVLEKCFSDNEWTREQESDDWIVKRFAGKDAGANFIRAWFTDVKKDIGGIYDRIDYTLVVKNGTVGNVCPLPIDIPEERISDVADAAMHLNQSLKYALFFVDFDNGKLWCSYSLPAAVLRSVEDASAANRYQAFIKTMALSGLAKNSGKFSELAAKKTQTDGDGKKTFSDDGNTVSIPLDEGIALLEKIANDTATGGIPLPKADEPLAFRYENATKAYYDSKIGFPKAKDKSFPQLKPVKNATGLKLDFAERFELAASVKLAQFPDGEIRWTVDGTNGLSLADTTMKMREAQVEIVKGLMNGRETANEPGTVWILNDDFIFGYGSGLKKDNEDSITYLFMIRHAMGGAPAGACALLDFAPTQAMSDSITGAFLGDKTAQENVKALCAAGIVVIVTEE